jgi:hypothetical protein
MTERVLFQENTHEESSEPFTSDADFDVAALIFVPLNSSTHIGKSANDIEDEVAQLAREESKARNWLVDGARTGSLRLWRHMLEKRVDVNVFSARSIRELQSFYSHESSERDKMCTRVEWRVRMKLYAQHEVALDHVIHRSKLSLAERSARVGALEQEATSWVTLQCSYVCASEAFYRAKVVRAETRYREHIESVLSPISIDVAAVPLEEARARSHILSAWRDEVVPLGESCGAALLLVHRVFIEDREDLYHAYLLGRSSCCADEFDEVSALQRHEICQRHSASCVDEVIIPSMRERHQLALTSALLTSVAVLEEEWRGARAEIEKCEEMQRTGVHLTSHCAEQETNARWSLTISLASDMTQSLHSLWAAHIVVHYHEELLRIAASMSEATLQEQRLRVEIDGICVLHWDEICARHAKLSAGTAERAQLSEGRLRGAVLLQHKRRRLLLEEQQLFEFELLLEHEASSAMEAVSNEELSARRGLQEFWALANGVRALEKQEACQRVQLSEALLRGSIALASHWMTQTWMDRCAVQGLALQEDRARQVLVSVESIAFRLVDHDGRLEPAARCGVMASRTASVAACVEQWSRTLVLAASEQEWTALLELFHRAQMVVAFSSVRRRLLTECLESCFEACGRALICADAFSSAAQWWGDTRMMQSLDPLWDAERRFRKQIEVTERNQRLDVYRREGDVTGSRGRSQTRSADRSSGATVVSPLPTLNSTQRKLYNEWAESVGVSGVVALHNPSTVPADKIVRSPHPPRVKSATASSVVSHHHRSLFDDAAHLPHHASPQGGTRRSLF